MSRNAIRNVLSNDTRIDNIIATMNKQDRREITPAGVLLFGSAIRQYHWTIFSCDRLISNGSGICSIVATVNKQDRRVITPAGGLLPRLVVSYCPEATIEWNSIEDGGFRLLEDLYRPSL